MIWLSDFVRDLKIAVRALTRRPGTAIVPIVSSALGISACSLIVGIANVALFRPLPVSDGSRLMNISAQHTRTGEIGSAISYPDYKDLVAAHSFENIAAYFPMVPAALSSDGREARRYWGTLATANYFDVIRPGFARGRGFDPLRDDTPGSPPVIVLSHHLWQSRFGADPALVGRTIVMSGRSATVIGITPPGFRGIEVAMVSDFWIPLSMRSLVLPMLPTNRVDLFADRDAKWLFVAGRLAQNATVEQANAEARVIANRLAASYPDTNKERGFHVERAGQLVAPVRRAMLVFFVLLIIICSLVLLTACANIANLLLARATARQKEMATRRAVGAGSGRLIRQLLTESILLSLAGGALGFAIAQQGARYFGHLRLPVSLPVDFSVSLDYRVLAACTIISFVTGLIFGLAPALYAVRQNLVSGLKDEVAQIGRHRWWHPRSLLMISQVAICAVLLICSGLFLRTLSQARSANTGMAYRNLVLISFDGAGTPDEILRQVRGEPGVESAAITTAVPLSLAGVSGRITPEAALDQKDAGVDSDIYHVSPRFFDTLGIRFLAGEDFRLDEPDVAILNRAAAERLFPAGTAVSRRVQTADRHVLRVIGVVANAKSRMIVEEPRPCIYRPFRIEESRSISGVTLLARVHGKPALLVPQLTDAVRKAEPGVSLFEVRTMDEHIQDALLLQRAGAFLFGLAGVTGILIAGAGLYGLISFVVSRQTKEIGIRMALGAHPGQILTAVLWKGLKPAVAGAALGLLIASMLSRGIASLLYGIKPTDTLTFLSVTLFLFVTAVAACAVPALRAANVSPNLSIRSE